MSCYEDVKRLETHINHRILGQEGLITRLLVALLADGNLLVEGAPGLAKTTVIKVLAAGVEGDFHRIQFTPDLLPADLTGTEVFSPQDGSFHFQQGPVFHNFILADEINRSPAKVQSALLEAMAERQVTVGRTTYPLDDMFLVMATQNPIEQEGTYRLPEAQRDRFLLHVSVDYPTPEAELEVVRLVRSQRIEGRSMEDIESPLVSRAGIFSARKQVLALHMAPELEEYIVQLVAASRRPEAYAADLTDLIAYGASPRGSIALEMAARAHAWLDNRDYVSPEDIHAMAADALRHRILLSYEAEADGVVTDEVIKRLLATVPVP
ncbi:MAG: MoxR family ATPase [Gammaproteobacteria bacterium]|nr:MoxR family ATPase [Gammaproteobacteria bacterium]